MDSNSFHGLRLLQWLSSANEVDEREVLIKLSFSSVVAEDRSWNDSLCVRTCGGGSDFVCIYASVAL